MTSILKLLLFFVIQIIRTLSHECEYYILELFTIRKKWDKILLFGLSKWHILIPPSPAQKIRLTNNLFYYKKRIWWKSWIFLSYHKSRCLIDGHWESNGPQNIHSLPAEGFIKISYVRFYCCSLVLYNLMNFFLLVIFWFPVMWLVMLLVSWYVIGHLAYA